MMSACSRAHVVAAGRPLSTRAQSPRARSTARASRERRPLDPTSPAGRLQRARARGATPRRADASGPRPELSNTSAPYDDAYVTLTGAGAQGRRDAHGGHAPGKRLAAVGGHGRVGGCTLDCRPVANGRVVPGRERRRGRRGGPRVDVFTATEWVMSFWCTTRTRWSADGARTGCPRSSAATS